MTPENQALLDAYPQYYKDVSHLEVIDVYRIINLYGVTDPTAQHSLKKLLLSGQRTGGKTVEKDLKEARDTLSRGLEMRKEDSRKLSPEMLQILSVGTSLSRGMAPVPYTPQDGPNSRQPWAPAQEPMAPSSQPLQCIEVGCGEICALHAIRCAKHCAPPPSVQPLVMSPVPVPQLPENDVYPQLPVAEAHPLPYIAPPDINPVQRGPVAASQGPKL